MLPLTSMYETLPEVHFMHDSSNMQLYERELMLTIQCKNLAYVCLTATFRLQKSV